MRVLRRWNFVVTASAAETVAAVANFFGIILLYSLLTIVKMKQFVERYFSVYFCCFYCHTSKCDTKPYYYYRWRLNGFSTANIYFLNFITHFDHPIFCCCYRFSIEWSLFDHRNLHGSLVNECRREKQFRLTFTHFETLRFYFIAVISEIYQNILVTITLIVFCFSLLNFQREPVWCYKDHQNPHKKLK